MEKKKRFTIIDFIIVAVVVIAALVAVFKLVPASSLSAEKVKAEFTVLVANQEKGLSDSIAQGDKVVISLTEKDSAIVKSVRTEDAQILTFNGDEGTYSNQSLNNKDDIYITLEGDATSDDTSVKIGNTMIKVGSELHIKGKGYTAVGYVIDMASVANSK